MISLDPITPRNAMIFKEIRLRALQDAPIAFSSTYAKEAQLSDADWIERALQWSEAQSVAYLALDKTIACGIAGAFLDHDDAALAHLVSMWVAPAHRRFGIASLLVKAITDWAHMQRVHTLRLLVTSNNHAAIRLYEHLGFKMTEWTAPHPTDPSLGDCEMSRAIS